MNPPVAPSGRMKTAAGTPLAAEEIDALRHVVGDSAEVERLLRYPHLARDVLARKLLETSPSKRPLKRERPRCGARTRAGRDCVAPAVWDAGAAAPRNGRCRNHGGLSTGPKTPEGLQRAAEALRKARERKRLEVEERKSKSQAATLVPLMQHQAVPEPPQVPRQPASKGMSARERQLVREELLSGLALPVRAEPTSDPWSVLRGRK